jgi:hypothetical protein
VSLRKPKEPAPFGAFALSLALAHGTAKLTIAARSAASRPVSASGFASAARLAASAAAAATCPSGLRTTNCTSAIRPPGGTVSADQLRSCQISPAPLSSHVLPSGIPAMGNGTRPERPRSRLGGRELRHRSRDATSDRQSLGAHRRAAHARDPDRTVLTCQMRTPRAAPRSGGTFEARQPPLSWEGEPDHDAWRFGRFTASCARCGLGSSNRGTREDLGGRRAPERLIGSETVVPVHGNADPFRKEIGDEVGSAECRASPSPSSAAAR